LSFAEVSNWAHHDIFSFFEPYGLRFHASIKNEDEWDRVRSQFEEKFIIRRIKPSLEDVFIHSVEDQVA